jgi:hypothetical protein
MRYLLAELLCILLIAVGVGMWVHVGAGLFIGGLLALVVTVAAQLPAGGDG